MAEHFPKAWSHESVVKVVKVVKVAWVLEVVDSPKACLELILVNQLS